MVSGWMTLNPYGEIEVKAEEEAMTEKRRIEEETQRRILHHNPDPQTSPPERQPLGEMDTPDGMVRLGSPLGERWGFVAKRFSGYLWRHGNVVTIPAIISHRNVEDDFCQLIEQILADGYTVQMLIDSTWRYVCRGLGFVKKDIPFARYGGVWVWEKRPEAPT